MTHDISKLYEDVEDIKEVVHQLDKTKQDRVKPWLLVPLVIYMLTQSFASVWWASDINSTLKSLKESVVQTSTDRLTSRDGEALARYLETRQMGTEEKVKILDDRVTEHRRDTMVCRERIKANEQALVELRARLQAAEDKLKGK